MDFDEVLEKRKSVRSFKNKKVSFEAVIEVVDAALKGPFAGNLNNLKFVVTEDEKKISKIAKIAGQHWITESSLVIVVCSDDTHLESQYGERGRVYSRQQAGAAINTVLLKLIDLGLSGCWVGSYTDELIRNIFGIPAHIQVEAIIPVGYEKGNAKKPKKHAIENITRWENWNVWRRPTIFAEPPIHR